MADANTKKICPKCSSKKIEEIKYNDKNEAIMHGALGGVGSGLAAGGIVAFPKIAIGAKAVSMVAAVTGGIAAPIAIPAAVLLGGSLLAWKAYSKTKTSYKCKKCGHIFY